MPDDTLPTEEEIHQLPRWARVAFAARCARRALPLFAKHWPTAPENHVKAVTRAVEVAEQSAAASAVNAAAAASAVNAAAADARPNAAADAAQAAGYADAAADAAAYYAYFAAYFAAQAAAAAVRTGVRIAFIRSAFQRIFDEATRNKWTDDTPVPPSVFGPLDEPESTATETTDPIEADEQITLRLKAFAEPGVSASVLAEHLVATYKALNEYTLAKYGRHLTRGHFRRLVCKHAGVPVA